MFGIFAYPNTIIMYYLVNKIEINVQQIKYPGEVDFSFGICDILYLSTQSNYMGARLFTFQKQKARAYKSEQDAIADLNSGQSEIKFKPAEFGLKIIYEED